MDPAIRIRIHSKMSWILNTGVYFTTGIHYQACILHFLKKDKNRCILENSYLVKPVQLIKRSLRDMYMPIKKKLCYCIFAFFEAGKNKKDLY